eukprot:scaffold8272_cov248-Pinguiococcus_pyrenoidosus.AAC.1
MALPHGGPGARRRGDVVGSPLENFGLPLCSTNAWQVVVPPPPTPATRPYRPPPPPWRFPRGDAKLRSAPTTAPRDGAGGDAGPHPPDSLGCAAAVLDTRRGAEPAPPEAAADAWRSSVPCSYGGRGRVPLVCGAARAATSAPAASGDERRQAGAGGGPGSRATPALALSSSPPRVAAPPPPRLSERRRPRIPRGSAPTPSAPAALHALRPPRLSAAALRRPPTWHAASGRPSPLGAACPIPPGAPRQEQCGGAAALRRSLSFARGWAILHREN